jgi:hypothetical protein
VTGFASSNATKVAGADPKCNEDMLITNEMRGTGEKREPRETTAIVSHAKAPRREGGQAGDRRPESRGKEYL